MNFVGQKRWRSTALAGLLLPVLCAPAWAGKFNKVLSVGDAAPAWAKLVGVDDQVHALADYAQAQALVIVFTCNHCPVAAAYEERLKQVQTEFAAQGVQVLAVNVNTGEEDGLEPMKTRADEHAWNFPYLYDPTQKIARDYGASVTPQVFVLDAARKIAYMGAIDDNEFSPPDVKQNFLRDALAAVLAGKAVAAPETKAKGCGIRYN